VLKHRDIIFVVSGVLFSIYYGLLYPFIDNLVLHELAGTWMNPPLVIAGLIIIFKALQIWEGEFSRSLDVIAVAFVCFMLVFIPHNYWHVVLGSQEWLGFTAPALGSFFHIFQAAAGVYFIYGFYLVWKLGGGDDV